MQPFEFSNNSISSLVSIFSTIMGIGYPLLLQTIERLDEKYKSERFARLFLQEQTFKCFQWLLAISIAFAISAVFVFEMLDGYEILTDIWVTAHSAVTLMLLYEMIMLVHLIIIYYDSEKLLKHFKELREKGHE